MRAEHEPNNYWIKKGKCCTVDKKVYSEFYALWIFCSFFRKDLNAFLSLKFIDYF